MTFTEIFMPIVVVIFLSIVFWIIGNKAVGYLNPKANHISVGLRSSLGFFLILSCFVSLWRILMVILPADVSLYSVFLILGILLIKTYKLKLEEVKFLGQVVLGMLFLGAFIFVFWAQNELDNTFSVVGSVHSPRYGNIALFINEFQRPPIIGQNYGQSLLASIPGFFGFQSPLFSLNLWVTSCLVFFIIFTYSVINFFFSSRLFSFLGVVAIFLGTSSLRLDHILVIDLGWPLLLNSYSDAIISIATLIICFFSINQVVSPQISKLKLYVHMALFLLICCHWSISAVQNFYLFSWAALAYISLNLNSLKSRFGIVAVVFFIFILGAIFGRFTGGMLVDKNLIEIVPFGGMLKLETQAKILDWNFGLPMMKGNYSGWGPVILDEDGFGLRLIKSIVGGGFIIIGLFFGFYLARLEKFLKYKHYIYIAIVVLMSSALVVLPISLFGSKWATTRFFLPGFYFAYLFLSLGIITVLIKKRQGALMFLVFVIIVSKGTLENIYTMVKQTTFSDETFLKRANAVIKFSKMMQD